MPPWLNFHDLIPVASRGYDITMTDLLNVFYRLDVAASGAVTRADFEAALVELGYTPPQAGTLFDSLDADGDGVLSMDDWTADASSALARLLAFRIIRRDVVGRDPRTTRRPPSSVRARCSGRSWVQMQRASERCSVSRGWRSNTRPHGACHSIRQRYGPRTAAHCAAGAPKRRPARAVAGMRREAGGREQM